MATIFAVMIKSDEILVKFIFDRMDGWATYNSNPGKENLYLLYRKKPKIIIYPNSFEM